MNLGCKTFRSALGQDFMAMVAGINAWLAPGTRRLHIFNASTHRRTLAGRADDFSVTLLYGESAAGAAVASGLTWQAFGFRSLSGGRQTAEQQATAFFALPSAGATWRPQWMLNATERASRAGGNVQLLGLAARVSGTAELSLFGHAGSTFIAAPLAEIAAGAAGAALILDADGAQVSASFSVINVSAARAWPAGQRNYIVHDDTAGRWIGVPSCCV